MLYASSSLLLSAERTGIAPDIEFVKVANTPPIPGLSPFDADSRLLLPVVEGIKLR